MVVEAHSFDDVVTLVSDKEEGCTLVIKAKFDPALIPVDAIRELAQEAAQKGVVIHSDCRSFGRSSMDSEVA